MDYILIGKIINTHGLKGELKIKSSSFFDDERYAVNNTVYLKEENSYIPMKIATYRRVKDLPLISFKEYQDINLVEPFKNMEIYFNKADRKPLKDGRHYIDELIGMRTVDEEGNIIGAVSAVESTNGAQNNLRIQRAGMKDALIPMIPFFVTDIDDDTHTITIHITEGLL
jgi:16S rRNA processing protein RimM